MLFNVSMQKITDPITSIIAGVHLDHYAYGENAANEYEMVGFDSLLFDILLHRPQLVQKYLFFWVINVGLATRIWPHFYNIHPLSFVFWMTTWMNCQPAGSQIQRPGGTFTGVNCQSHSSAYQLTITRKLLLCKCIWKQLSILVLNMLT